MRISDWIPALRKSRATTAAVAAPATGLEPTSGAAAMMVVREALGRSGWCFEERPELQGWTVSFAGDNLRWRMYVRIEPEVDLIHVHSVYDMLAPPELRVAAAEYITRVNYVLRLGHFEMDFADGEVRFVCVLDYENGLPTREAVARAMACSTVATDRYYPGLAKVMHGGVEPEVALAVLRRRMESPEQ